MSGWVNASSPLLVPAWGGYRIFPGVWQRSCRSDAMHCQGRRVKRKLAPRAGEQDSALLMSSLMAPDLCEATPLDPWLDGCQPPKLFQRVLFCPWYPNPGPLLLVAVTHYRIASPTCALPKDEMALTRASLDDHRLAEDCFCQSGSDFTSLPNALRG
ncbi:hypothetical protein GGI42DRAFT_11212 [Trichoderma sp. SZMC 28013]